MLLKNANVIPVVGEPFIGDVAIADGKIIAMGRDLTLADDEVYDLTGKTIIPGIIDAHCHIGMFEDGIGFEGDDGNEYSTPVTPELRAIDAINPYDRCFAEAREGGVTTVITGPGSANVIGGQFVALKTSGKDVEDMILQFPVAMKAAFGENPKRVYSSSKQFYTRMAVAAALRKALKEAQEYDRKLMLAGDDESKKPAFDIKMEALLPVIRRELPLKIHAHRADDILTALRIAKEFNLRITLDHCTEGYMICDLLKEAISDTGAGVIIGPLLSDRSKVELRNLSFSAPKKLYDSGIEFAMMTDHPVIPIQYLPVCAAIAVREGLPEEAALKSITINAARIIGVDDRIGSLEVGKDADLAVFSGHPFDFRANCVMTIINGRIVNNKLC